MKIPVWIKELTGLNKTDRQVYSQLIFFTQTTGKTEHRAKNQYLADLVGVCPTQISRILKKLELLGLIAIEIFDRYDRVITVVADRLQKMSNPPDKTPKHTNKMSEETPKKPYWQAKKEGYYKESIKKPDLDLFQEDDETLEQFDDRCESRSQEFRITRHCNQKSSHNQNGINKMKEAYNRIRNKLIQQKCSNFQMS